MSNDFGERLLFYKEAIDSWIVDKKANILIVGGAQNDYRIFRDLGFQNVTLTNLDDEVRGSNYPPYKESCQNAEALTFEDDSFDYSVINAALHHCYSPHTALIEMLRVSRKGIVMIESRDSWVMRLLEKYKLTQTYEYSAVWHNSGKSGGVQNSQIPNHIYRWTEREIEKTVRSAFPLGPSKFQYRYGNSYPRTSKIEKKSKLKDFIIQIMRPVYAVFAMCFKKQQNMFAAYIEKLDANNYFPWISLENNNPTFNHVWAKKHLK